MNTTKKQEMRERVTDKTMVLLMNEFRKDKNVDDFIDDMVLFVTQALAEQREEYLKRLTEGFNKRKKLWAGQMNYRYVIDFISGTDFEEIITSLKDQE